ncbi:dynamin-like GTPase OPA1, mitochondrial isoform X3 [Artemia franciscana]|uniref:Uncharacterized protein n=1 Tax=Artemia franciscana TaxID=6661 RepID=A0AA88L6Y0_ARTSF|nr:hypothetical protein QYM36_004911 [Artemia franciscana]
MAMLIVRNLKGVLKIRYLMIGGAIYGGVSVKKTYDEWKNKLDSLYRLIRVYIVFRKSLIRMKDKVSDTVKDFKIEYPSDESLGSYRESLIRMKDKVSDTVKDFKIEYLSDESLGSYRESLIRMKDKVSDTVKDFKIDPRLPNIWSSKEKDAQDEISENNDTDM